MSIWVPQDAGTNRATISLSSTTPKRFAAHAFHRFTDYHVRPLGTSASTTKENRPVWHSVQLHRLQAAGRLKEKLAHSHWEQHCPSSHSDVKAGRSNAKIVSQYGHPILTEVSASVVCGSRYHV